MPSVFFMDEMFLWTAANLPLMPCASFKISVDGESSSSDSASTVLQACSVSAAARSFTSHLPIHVRTCSRQILHTNIAYNIYHIIYIYQCIQGQRFQHTRILHFAHATCPTILVRAFTTKEDSSWSGSSRGKARAFNDFFEASSLSASITTVGSGVHLQNEKQFTQRKTIVQTKHVPHMNKTRLLYLSIGQTGPLL